MRSRFKDVYDVRRHRVTRLRLDDRRQIVTVVVVGCDLIAGDIDWSGLSCQVDLDLVMAVAESRDCAYAFGCNALCYRCRRANRGAESL